MTNRNPFLGFISSLAQRILPSNQINEQVTTGSSMGVGNISVSALGAGMDGRELRFTPVRSPARARRLSELASLPEVGTMISMICLDVFSSQDGDDLGFVVADTLQDGETPVDPRVKEILTALIVRCLDGNKLETVVQEMLEGGDGFRSILLDKGLTKVVRLKELPAWEMFRIEDEDGDVIRFEQRQYAQQQEAVYTINPAVCVHWRFRRNRLYGRALFEEMWEDGKSLNNGYESLNSGIISAGVNPNVHTMPLGTDAQYKDSYKRQVEEVRRRGKTITDYYCDPPIKDGGTGGTVTKMATSWNPDLSGLLDNVDRRRRRFAMQGRVPLYLLGMETSGSKDIAGQPALAYSRFINGIRANLSEGIKQICNVELALNGIYDAQYRLQWPKVYVHALENAMSGDAGNAGEMEEEPVGSDRVLRLSNRRVGYGG